MFNKNGPDEDENQLAPWLQEFRIEEAASITPTFKEPPR